MYNDENVMMDNALDDDGCAPEKALNEDDDDDELQEKHRKTI
jgi:hypothetical protein